MATSDIVQIVIYLGILVFLAVPLGSFIGQVLDGKGHFLQRPLGWLEHLLYRCGGIDPTKEMTWKAYGLALAVFNLAGFVILLLLQLLQSHLPLNPANLPNVPFWLALNTAISFVTNTNWQAYSGESTMSYLTQMLGLGVQNFLSAATGLAVAAALARGLAKKSSPDLGNFWTDTIRSTVYVLLPLSIIFAVILVSQGVVQNFSSYLSVRTIDGSNQTIPFGPAASQIAIKQLGTNGGGFFGVNSAHPFENPTPLSNFLQTLAILLIPASLPIAFGRMAKNMKHGLSVLAVMFALLLASFVGTYAAESMGNPILGNLGFLEGKEVRFGLGNSVLWTVTTTLASNGSVNSMISSFAPLSGGIAILNIMLGEVVFGGVGSGMYGMALFVILAVFIAGLMVGRTPEYLGKKIEAPEIKLAVVGVLAPSVVILTFAAIASISAVGLSSLAHKGPHGLSEILYAFASAAGNNGSAFAGLGANTPFYNTMLSVAMLVGRYAVIFPVLAIAGKLAAKKQTPASTGTFPTEGSLFALLLASTVLIVGALTFFPALCLGPIMEHFLMLSGRTF
jgi:K+-transporting ATPase ATPase A chain